MKYVALLRAINVGGNSLIKMADLKVTFEQLGFTNVVTYINSGNVIFETPEKNTAKLTSLLEKTLSKTFDYQSKVIVLSHAQMKEVIEEAPATWHSGADLRKYVSFLKAHVVITEIVEQIQVREHIDALDVGKNVLYMSTKMDGLTKSGFTKIIGTKIYKEMSWRNWNTVQKIWAIMER